MDNILRSLNFVQIIKSTLFSTLELKKTWKKLNLRHKLFTFHAIKPVDVVTVEQVCTFEQGNKTGNFELHVCRWKIAGQRFEIFDRKNVESSQAPSKRAATRWQYVENCPLALRRTTNSNNIHNKVWVQRHRTRGTSMWKNVWMSERQRYRTKLTPEINITKRTSIEHNTFFQWNK